MRSQLFALVMLPLFASSATAASVSSSALPKAADIQNCPRSSISRGQLVASSITTACYNRDGHSLRTFDITIRERTILHIQLYAAAPLQLFISTAGAGTGSKIGEESGSGELRYVETHEQLEPGRYVLAVVGAGRINANFSLKWFTRQDVVAGSCSNLFSEPTVIGRTRTITRPRCKLPPSRNAVVESIELTTERDVEIVVEGSQSVIVPLWGHIGEIDARNGVARFAATLPPGKYHFALGGHEVRYTVRTFPIASSVAIPTRRDADCYILDRGTNPINFASAPILEVGAIRGQLRDTSCEYQGRTVDYYRLRVVNAGRHVLSMQTQVFPPSLLVLGSAWTRAGLKTAGQMETSAELALDLAPGEYLILATAAFPGASGTYVLTHRYTRTAEQTTDDAIAAYRRQDYAAAFGPLREAGERGHSTAQAMLGYMYWEGMGVARDQTESLRWYRLSATQGHSDGIFGVGHAHYFGGPVPRNHGEAFRWFQRAADLGHRDAQHAVGYMYLHGEGVERDPGQAYRWFRLAADRQQASAQMWLGYMYQNGVGVAFDREEAIRWYRLAAANGYAGAREELGNLGAQ